MQAQLKIVAEDTSDSGRMVKPETVGQYLERVRRGQGLSLNDLERLIKGEVSSSNISKVERDVSGNPGVKTIEAIARGLGLQPLDVIGRFLERELEITAGKTERGFSKSRLMRLWKLYAGASPQMKTLVDEIVQMLIDRLSRKD